jgi:glucose dehydrogenase
MFVFTKYEIVGFEKIFIPAALFILGVSLLTGNLLVRLNKASLILSAVIIIAGIWFIWDKGNANLELFSSAVFAILKKYWLIIILTAAVIGLVSYWFNRRIDKMN